MIVLPAYGAVPLPDFPRMPERPTLDGALVFLVIAFIVVGVLTISWYLSSHAPGKGARSGLTLMLLFALTYVGMIFYGLSREAAWEAEIGVVIEERDVISARTAQEVADWYGVFPIEINSESVENWFVPAFVEVDGVVPTDCYTLVRDGQLGIACGPEPESYEEALATLVELPRADDRAAATEGGEGS